MQDQTISDNNSKILIIDDNYSFSRLLQIKLDDLGYSKTFISSTYSEGLEMIRNIKPNLVFVDIYLDNQNNGIDLVRKIKEDIDVPIIFMTSNYYEQVYDLAKSVAPKAFISKDLTNFELKKVVELAMIPTTFRKNKIETKDNYNDFLFVKVGANLSKLYVKDICYLSTEGNYSKAHIGEQKYLISQSLKKIEELLPVSHFIRVHQSHIANMKKIKNINIENNYVVFKNNVKIPLSRRHKKSFLERIRLV